MLLDRKRVKFWQKIIFSLMAVLMIGFGLWGVLSALPGCNSDQQVTSVDDRIARLKQQVKASPSDQQLVQELAAAYQEQAAQYEPGSNDQVIALERAARYTQQYVDILAASQATSAKKDLTDAYGTLAGIYSNLQDYDALVRVYAALTELQPDDAETYLFYAQAAQSAGKADVAILAYRKYLELEPQGDYAEEVRDLLDDLVGEGAGSTDGGQ